MSNNNILPQTPEPQYWFLQPLYTYVHRIGKKVFGVAVAPSFAGMSLYAVQDGFINAPDGPKTNGDIVEVPGANFEIGKAVFADDFGNPTQQSPTATILGFALSSTQFVVKL